ncbi:transmembrane protein [Ceratobasidium sp. AG-Ba]|nr:transmembrane protein [Ceratobasidium sp. AG-Ba]QRW10794.1 transmembrane protein [Ceratobasidium sp. AG-Ba]
MNGDHRDNYDDLPKRKGLPPVAKFVCGAASFKLVLSTGLAIPFLFAKRRAALPQAAVHLSKKAGVLGTRSNASSATTLPPLRLLRDKEPVGTGPGEGGQVDTLGAIRHALKAFGIATMLVGVGTGTVLAGFTFGLGITTLGEFQSLMRSLVRSKFPQLHAELHSARDPVTADYYRTEIWERERVEKALEDALAAGGWSAWLDEARRQLERERAVKQRIADMERGGRLSRI